MSVRNILMAAAGAADDKLYVDDVFSAYTYTGNGSTRTINNGIDLAGKGGMVWIKERNVTWDHMVVDTARGVGQYSSLQTNKSNTAAAYGVGSDFTAFNSNGFTLGVPTFTNLFNGSGFSFISWTFRKAPKFFDVVTGVGPGTFTHMLGVTPGMVIMKPSSVADNWYVNHRSLTGGITGSHAIILNSTAAEWAAGSNQAHTDTTVNVWSAIVDGSTTWVAYLFAHDPSADGIVQCGSFTADGSGNTTVNHGWTKGVQFALLKASSTMGDWEMFDTARTAGWSGSDARLHANLSAGEDSVSRLSASGTSVSFTGLSSGATYIYMFIVNP